MSGIADHSTPAVVRDPRRHRPRLVPTLATVAAIAVGIAAGQWQQERMHAKQALRTRYDDAARAARVSLASLPTDADWKALRYRPVAAIGEYLPQEQIFIDNKMQAGRVGYHVVTPLRLFDGRVVLVDRGWIAQRASRSELPGAPPPAGPVTVHGRLALAPVAYLELEPDSTSGPIRQNLDPARFADATGLPVLPAIIEAMDAPIPDDGLVRAWPAPDFGIETHRIYMVQWYSFAMLAALLWLWFHRPHAGSGR